MVNVDLSMDPTMRYIPGDLVRCARRVAILAHTACNQRYGDLPYVAHLADVASNAIAFIDLIDEPARDLVVAAAWLHDVLEDTHTTYSDLREQIINGQHVRESSPTDAHVIAEIVFALTNNKGRDRSARADERYYSEIRKNPLAMYVKLCDRLANVQNAGAMVAKYKKEHQWFRMALNSGDYAPLWAEIERLLGATP